MGNKRNYLIIFIAMFMLFNFAIQPVFADNDLVDQYLQDRESVEGEIDPEDDEYDEDAPEDNRNITKGEQNITKGEQDITEYEFSQVTFDKMLDIFLGPYEKYFPEYAADSEIVATVPHATVARMISGNKSIVNLDKQFIKVDHFRINESVEPQGIYSDYINVHRGDGSYLNFLQWKTSGHQARFFKNMFAAGMVQDPPSNAVSIQVDSYGNLITNNQQVITPFFMQDSFTQLILNDIKNNDLMDLPSEISKNIDTATFIPFIPDIEVLNALGPIYASNLLGDKGKNFNAFVINDSGEIVSLRELGYTDAADILTWLRTPGFGDEVLSPRATRDFITTYYQPYIEEFTKGFVEYAETARELENTTGFDASYLGPTDLNSALYSSDPEEEREALLENMLTTILTGGFGRLAQLTVAYTVAEIYEELFINFSSKYIFHTSDYTETNTFNNIFGAYIVLVLMLIIVNLVVSSINILRGATTLSKTIMRIGLIIAISIIPLFVYNKLVSYAFNEAPSNITSNQIKQVMILDRWSLISKQDSQEEDKKELLFTLKRDFRGLQYNYLIDFNTDQFVSEVNRYAQEDFLEGRGDRFEEGYDDELYLEQELSKSRDTRVKLYVDANHLIDYFYNSSDGEELFDYLSANYSNFYMGLNDGVRKYSEYAYYMNDKTVLDTSVFTDKVTSSEIGRLMYKYYDTSEIDLAERLSAVSDYMIQHNLSNAQRDQFISRVSGIPYLDNRTYYDSVTEDDFRREEDYQAFLREKEIMELIGYGDVTGLYGFMKEITVAQDGGYDTETVDVAKLNAKHNSVVGMVKEINQEVIFGYLDVVNNMSAGMGYSLYNEQLLVAIHDITLLDMYFEVSQRLGNNYFPKDILASKVESDVYIRALVIPLSDMTPNNVSISNAALYVGSNKSIWSLGSFTSMIIMLTVYGLLKLFVVSKLLLPVLMVLLVWNYLIKEDYTNKTIFGAIYILGAFALVHWGFLALWKYTVSSMNANMATTVGGRSSFFNTGTNTIMVCVYFIVVLKYVIYPTLKTAVENPSDLGGAVQYERAGTVVKNVASKLTTGGAALLGMGVAKDKSKVIEERGADTKKTDELRKDKQAADRVKDKSTGKDGLGDEVEEEINKRKKGTEEVTEEEVKKGLSLKDRFGRTSKDIEQARKEKEPITKGIKDKLETLKKHGKFGAKTESTPVGGSSSNKLKTKNDVLAGSIGGFLSKKGIDSNVKGKSVHFDATNGEVMDLETELQDHIAKSTEELKTIKTAEGDTVVGAHEISRLSFDQNPDLDDQLDKMKEEGLIESYTNDMTDDGEMRTNVIGANANQISNVEKMIKEYGSEDINKSIQKDNVVRFNDNQATYEAMKTLGINGESFINSNGEDLLEVAASPTKSKELIKELEELGNALNEVEDMGVEPTPYVKLNANNDMVNHHIGGAGIQEGIDYTKQGSEYVSLNKRGYSVMNDLSESLEFDKESVIEDYNNIGQLKISSSGDYVYSDRGQGYQHNVQNLTYEPSEIIKEINDLRKYEGTEQSLIDAKKHLESALDIKATRDGIVMYTKNEVSSDEISKIMNTVQSHRLEKLRQKERTKKENEKKASDGMDTLKSRMGKGE